MLSTSWLTNLVPHKSGCLHKQAFFTQGPVPAPTAISQGSKPPYTCGWGDWTVRNVQAQMRGQCACAVSSQGESLTVRMALIFYLPSLSSYLKSQARRAHQLPSLLRRSIHPKAFVFWPGGGTYPSSSLKFSFSFMSWIQNCSLSTCESRP